VPDFQYVQAIEPESPKIRSALTGWKKPIAAHGNDHSRRITTSSDFFHEAPFGVTCLSRAKCPGR